MAEIEGMEKRPSKRSISNRVKKLVACMDQGTRSREEVQVKIEGEEKDAEVEREDPGLVREQLAKPMEILDLPAVEALGSPKELVRQPRKKQHARPPRPQRPRVCKHCRGLL